MFKEWPSGQLPEELQRPELRIIKENGYNWKDPHDVIRMFEEKVAEFAGSKYAVAVDSCSNALFLSMKYAKCKGTITIPARTYISVPMQIKHAGCDVAFEDIKWKQQYQLKPYNIWDAATVWQEGMFQGMPDDALQCVSFQMKKRIPIGKGGMILTNDEEAYRWLRVVSHDGRVGGRYNDMHFDTLGWHMNMTPEDAARGIILMDSDQKIKETIFTNESYTDVSKFRIFK
jgi:dTDP-4-amino-4,6-dideoxygalactose transaminase